MPIVQMPDGAQVQFPDDMPPDRIRSLIEQKFPDARQQLLERGAGGAPQDPLRAQDPPATPLEETPSAFEALRDVGGVTDGEFPFRPQVGMQGAGRALADTVAAPFDLVNAGVNTLASGAELGVNAFLDDEDEIALPRFGSVSDQVAQTFSELFERMGGSQSIDPEDMSFKERMSYNVNRFGGAAGIGSGALATRAAVRSADELAKPTMLNAMTRPYVDDAVKTGIGDMAGALGSGTLMTAAEEVMPDSVLAQLAAALLGGTAGSTLATVASSPKSAWHMAKDSLPASNIDVDPETQMPVTNRVADKTARFVQANADDPKRAAETGARTTREANAEGLPAPTFGAASDDMGVIGLEKRSRMQADNQPDYLKRDRQIRDAAVDEVQSLRPADADPEAPRPVARRELDTQRAGARQQVDTAESAEQQARAAEAEQSAPVAGFRGREGEASANLDRTVVEETMRPRQQAKNQRFADIDPDRSVQRDVAPMVRAAQEVRDRLPEGVPASEYIPETHLSAIERLVDPETGEGTIAFADMQKMRPILSEAEKKARSNGDIHLADAFRRLRMEVGEEAQRLADEGGEAGTRAKDAIKYYETEFAPFFARGEGGKLRKDVNADDTFRSKTPPTKTAARFLRAGHSGSREAAQDLRRIIDIAPDPQAGQAAVREYVLSNLAGVVQGDRVNLNLLRKWRADRSEMLRPFPELAKEIDDFAAGAQKRQGLTTKLGQDLKKVTRDMADIERELDKSALSIIADKAPTNAVSDIMGAGDPVARVREVRNGPIGKDERAWRGFKAAVADWAEDKVRTTNTGATESGDAAVSFAKLFNFWEKNEKALKEVFDGAELNALRRARKTLEPMQNLNAQTLSGSPTGERAALLARTLEVGLKGTLGILKGGGVFRTLKIALPGLFNDPDVADIERLVTRMMFDPDLAAHLLTRETRAVGTPRWNKKLNQLLALGAAAREVNDEDAGE